MGKYKIKVIQHSQSSKNESTTLTAALSNVTVGNIIICVVVNREETVNVSDGWKSVGFSNGFGDGATNLQKEYFFSKVATSPDETITITQSGTGRIYAIMAEFSNVESLKYDSSLNKLGTANYSVSVTKEVNKCILYGVHAVYCVPGRNQTCSPLDLQKLEGDSSGERLACWFDNGNGEQTHIFITYNVNDNHSAEVAGIELIPYQEKYLICENDKFYNNAGGTLAELHITELTSDVFMQYGNDEIPDGSLLMNLTNPNVLCWTNNKELPAISATVSAVPLPQTVISNAIDLTHESITGIENMVATCEGDLIIAVSFDNKQTWKAWNGSEWSTLSEEFTGMNKETLEAITFEQWNLLYDGATGFYIRIALVDTTQSVTEIYTDFAN